MAPLGMFYTVAAATLLASVGVVSAEACVGDCVGNWQQCGGDGVDGPKACCNEGFNCYSLESDGNVDYRQCRRDDSVNTGWVIPPMDCEPTLEDPNVMCAGEAGDPPILVEIGKPFTIATTTTVAPDLAFCEVVDSTQAPILPLTGTVSASETHITRTLRCTVGEDNVRVSCEFDITLTGEPNITPFAADEDADAGMAAAFAATAEDPPEDIILIL